MAVTGDWKLYYDWNCDGSYASTTMTVKADGTWTNGDGGAGLWVQVAGMFMFQFNNTKTTYCGDFASKSVTGISTTFTGLKGCFYMLQSGVPALAAEAAKGKEKANAAGVVK